MKYRQATNAIILFFALGQSVLTAAQEGPFRVSDQQVSQLLAQLDTHTGQFQKTLETALVPKGVRNSLKDNYILQFTEELKQLTARLHERSKKHRPISSEVQEVLNRGPYLETFMRSYELNAPAQNAWQVLAADLTQLASYYRIETYWGLPTAIGAPPRPELETMANRLIGTYKLEEAQSENVRQMAEETVKELPAAERRRILTSLLQHLRSPSMLALDRHADQITLATSLHAARVYQATAHAYSDRTENETVLLYGNQFRLNTRGEANGHYSVTYASIEQGARLHVMYTAFLPDFARPLIVISYYKKVSDIPQLNLGTEETETSPSDAEGEKKIIKRLNHE